MIKPQFGGIRPGCRRQFPSAGLLEFSVKDFWIGDAKHVQRRARADQMMIQDQSVPGTVGS